MIDQIAGSNGLNFSCTLEKFVQVSTKLCVVKRENKVRLWSKRRRESGRGSNSKKVYFSKCNAKKSNGYRRKIYVRLFTIWASHGAHERANIKYTQREPNKANVFLLWVCLCACLCVCERMSSTIKLDLWRAWLQNEVNVHTNTIAKQLSEQKQERERDSEIERETELCRIRKMVVELFECTEIVPCLSCHQ